MKSFKSLIIVLTVTSLLPFAFAQVQDHRNNANMDTTNSSSAPVPTSTPTPSIQTLCIGRVQFEVPSSFWIEQIEGVKESLNMVKLGHIRVRTKPNTSHEEFKRLVQDRWTEMQTYKTNSLGAPYVQPAQMKKLNDNMFVLSFHHEMIPQGTSWVNGELVIPPEELINDVEGYVWDKGTVFIVTAQTNPPDNRNIMELMGRLHYRADHEIPQQAGICLNGGFIEHHFRSTPEYYVWGVDFTNGLEVSMIHESTPLKVSPLEAIERLNSTKNNEPDYGYQVYRSRHLGEYAIPADEVVSAYTKVYANGAAGKKTYENLYQALWESMGANEPQAQPTIRVKMELKVNSLNAPKELGDYPAAFYGSKHPSEEAFYEAWDMIVKTIRFYPGALAPAPAAEELETAPMPNTSKISRDKQMLDDFLKNG